MGEREDNCAILLFFPSSILVFSHSHLILLNALSIKSTIKIQHPYNIDFIFSLHP